MHDEGRMTAYQYVSDHQELRFRLGMSVFTLEEVKDRSHIARYHFDISQ